MIRKFFLGLSFIALLYFAYGFYFATFDNSIFKKGTTSAAHSLFHDYTGVSHVVTTHSKGSMDPTQVLIEAAQAQLNFLIFTDLNVTDRPYSISGYHGDVFAFSNQKISYLDSHVLVYSDNPDFHFDSLASAHAQLHHHFSEQKQGPRSYLAVLAHPHKKHHRWSGPYPSGLDGIEVINLRQLWQEGWIKDKPSFLWSLITFPFNPQVALLRLIREPRKELELWDQLNKESKTIGFLGNETTARIFRFLGINFTFLSYEKSFKFASNHLLLASELTGHGDTDRKKIFQALEKGQFYLAFDSLGSPLGFASYFKCNDNNYLLGSEVQDTNCRLMIDLPPNLDVPRRVDVIHNGQLIFSSNSLKSELEVSKPGAYRVEVKIQPRLPVPDAKKWYGWIYTNPIFLK
jgi:hypothetical protein